MASWVKPVLSNRDEVSCSTEDGFDTTEDGFDTTEDGFDTTEDGFDTCIHVCSKNKGPDQLPRVFHDVTHIFFLSFCWHCSMVELICWNVR